MPSWAYSTGVYISVCDGTSPGAPVLADGLAVYTPGLSENRNGLSSFTHDDLLGGLRFFTDASQNVTANLLSDAFGETVIHVGAIASPFQWNGASGYQSDNDGLKLLGHRYYDSRTGRFISQDPAGAGSNWYRYVNNNPVNKTDPSGLAPMDGPGSSPLGSPGYSNIGGGGGMRAGSDLATSMMENLYNASVDTIRAQATVNWVFNLVGPSASISLGPIHFDGNLGIAIQGPGLGATGWGLEAFGSVNAGLGIGLGVSISSGKIANLGSFGFGVGNLNGFNGGSWFGTILAQPITSLTYSQALGGGYKGVQVGLPLGGIDVGLYGGLGYTLPIFSTGHRN